MNLSLMELDALFFAPISNLYWTVTLCRVSEGMRHYPNKTALRMKVNLFKATLLKIHKLLEL
jgi:hypothetical protein